MQNKVNVMFTRNLFHFKWTHPNDKDGQVDWSKMGQTAKKSIDKNDLDGLQRPSKLQKGQRAHSEIVQLNIRQEDF